MARRRYEIYFKRAADRELRRLPEDAQRRIVAEIEQLAFEPRPHGVVKPAGDDNLWRIRVGLYRVVYEIHDREIEVLVLRIGHRKDIYRGGKPKGR